ncbi:hypothetical protein [Piscinibacter terrae]|uniref:Uncharacterized protein n=1 Tax=Piscinibacter terrae TaxID=2496871 RepID=A0A3N7JWC5_9BURK|nr:hypothetical protein [Albitalea terrae]RQP23175.1 hypothetical protein DZC73_18860 [Albitalea terrae]
MHIRRHSLGLSGCGGGTATDERSADNTSRSLQAQAQAEAPPPVLFGNSFVITNRTALDRVAPDFKVGALLYAVNRHLSKIAKDYGKKPHDDKVFTLRPFQVAADDVDGHNAVQDTDKVAKVGTVPVIYNTFRNLILKDGAFDPDTGTEPFRLIAVVNRLDLAGDFDMRGGGILAGADRRWFGEARLVFAVKGKLPDGSPLPMTVSAEYRLPALKTDAQTGAIVIDPDFKFDVGPASEDDWRIRRQLWAQVWQGLSASPVDSAEYATKLRGILSWVAYGIAYDKDLIKTTETAEHNLAFRTGERVREGVGVDQQGPLTPEFEYREFYLNDAWMLSTRKLRREPFACANASQTLADRIMQEWWSSTASMSWRYTLGERNLDAGEITDLKATCPSGKLPYGQVDDNKDTQLRAKFTRFTADTRWKPGTAKTPLNEKQMHSFAIGTCSGCHGKETGTGGFHIAPAAGNAPAILSPFLTAPTSSTPREQLQKYDEPTRRTALVARFANGDAVSSTDDPLLYDIGCRNVDQVCLPKP